MQYRLDWLHGNVLCITSGTSTAAQLCRNVPLPSLLCGRDVHEDSHDPQLGGTTVKGSGTCTCKNVVQSRACALECYFLGNGVRKANQAWMVLWHWSRKQGRKVLARKRAGSCTKKADFCSEASPTMTFLHIGAGIQLLFAYQITMEEGKKPILVGPCC